MRIIFFHRRAAGNLSCIDGARTAPTVAVDRVSRER